MDDHNYGDVSLREFLEQRLNFQDQKLVSIEEQVIKTNGTVKKHGVFIIQAKVVLAILGGVVTLVVLSLLW